MKILGKSAVMLAATATLLAPLLGGTASPAAADNCEPSEPIMRVLFAGYEERITDERDSALCYGLRGFVYPRLCDSPSLLLGSCINTLRPNPFAPITVPAFSPNGGRIVCNLQTYVLTTTGVSGPTCSSTAGAGLHGITEHVHSAEVN